VQRRGSCRPGAVQGYGAALKLYEGRGHWLLEEPGWDKIASDIGAWLRTTLAVAAPLPAAS
jgi:hypothetical protein